MKKSVYRSTFTIAGIIAISLCISYLVYNIIFFMVITGLLLLVSPILYSCLMLKTKNGDDSKLLFCEIISCLIFSLVIIGFSHYITITSRFQNMVAPLLSGKNITIQEFNFITYIFGFLIYLGIYIQANKSIKKKP
ncbi:MAG: hypothetical protein ACK5KQ_01135 [Anaerorhabdus sp.]